MAQRGYGPPHAMSRRLLARLVALIVDRFDLGVAGRTEVAQQRIERPCCALEAVGTDALSPVAFDLGDDATRGPHRVPARIREADELGASIARVGSALDDAQPLQVIDHLRHRRERHARLRGELGKSGAIRPDVGGHVRMRNSRVGEAGRHQALEELVLEDARELDQQLAQM